MEESQVSTDKTPPTSPARVRRSGVGTVRSFFFLETEWNTQAVWIARLEDKGVSEGDRRRCTKSVTTLPVHKTTNAGKVPPKGPCEYVRYCQEER